LEPEKIADSNQLDKPAKIADMSSTPQLTSQNIKTCKIADFDKM